MTEAGIREYKQIKQCRVSTCHSLPTWFKRRCHGLGMFMVDLVDMSHYMVNGVDKPIHTLGIKMYL